MKIQPAAMVHQPGGYVCVIIHKLYGIEPTLETKLKAQGIKDSEDLLRAC